MLISIKEFPNKIENACQFKGEVMLKSMYGLPQISGMNGEAWIRDGKLYVKMELDIREADVEWFGILSSLSDGRLQFNGDMSIGYGGRGRETPIKIYFVK